jgi:hypothetical protein
MFMEQWCKDANWGRLKYSYHTCHISSFSTKQNTHTPVCYRTRTTAVTAVGQSTEPWHSLGCSSSVTFALAFLLDSNLWVSSRHTHSRQCVDNHFRTNSMLIQNVAFILFLIMSGLSHRNPASPNIPWQLSHSPSHDQEDTLCILQQMKYSSVETTEFFVEDLHTCYYYFVHLSFLLTLKLLKICSTYQVRYKWRSEGRKMMGHISKNIGTCDKNGKGK